MALNNHYFIKHNIIKSNRYLFKYFFKKWFKNKSFLCVLGSNYIKPIKLYLNSITKLFEDINLNINQFELVYNFSQKLTINIINYLEKFLILNKKQNYFDILFSIPIYFYTNALIHLKKYNEDNVIAMLKIWKNAVDSMQVLDQYFYKTVAIFHKLQLRTRGTKFKILNRYDTKN